MTNVILAVDLKINGRNFHAGSTANVDRTHAGNLVHRGLARYPEATAPDPAADKPDTGDKSGSAGNKGKE